ncbi:hypothetical protein F2Q69_00015209 [Brassica cretica]|uniref:Uncharacterized protein n=1 Tax=Brassica cretica TaxID=69181 RepID=A0A8S9R6M7_BRACR|nr:hypothetical protein F2Q69_00015209 [Brassica cretica]
MDDGHGPFVVGTQQEEPAAEETEVQQPEPVQFEVNQHPVADVMPVLLKSGQSASREEAVGEMKDCRSMKQHWYRSTVMPEYGMTE